MKDERIIKELNQVKLILLTITFITTMIIAMIKVIATETLELEQFYIELFIIASIFILGIIFLVFYIQDFDERKEKLFGFITNIFFLVTLFGSFAIHFYSVAKNFSTDTYSYYPTSLLLLIGFLILIFLLKKKNIYLHYSYFNMTVKQYRIFILKRVLLFSILFSLNIIPFIVYNVHWIIGLILIAISIFSLMTVYIIFAFYEYNHYIESELAFENIKRYISKNVTLFMLIPLIIGLILAVVSYQRNIMMASDNYENLIQIPYYIYLSLIQEIIVFSGIDFAIYSLIAWIILSKNLKEWRIDSLIISLIKTYFILIFILSVSNTLWNITVNTFFPIFFNGMESVPTVITINKIFYFIGFLPIIIFSLAIFYFWKKEYEKFININYKFLIYIFILSNLISRILFRIIEPLNSNLLITIGLIFSLINITSLYIFFKIQEKHTANFQTS